MRGLWQRSGAAGAIVLVALLPAGAAGQPAGQSAPPAAATPAVPRPGPPPVAALTPGTLVPRVECTAHPGQSYALYLPAGYQAAQAGRRWPIVYVMDPRGRGELAAEIFQAGAERYGFILASSYGTASDGPFEPNLTAMQAMWTDTHARFAIDDKRVYAAGFSGTVRAACVLAHVSPGTFAGIIGSGAGFPFEDPPQKTTSFAFFGTVGVRDFNFYEMLDLDARLDELRLPHRLEVFDGTHEWLSPQLAGRALGWMELQAVKTGRRPPSAELVEALFQEESEAARQLELAGRRLDALRAYRSLAADFNGLHDVSAAAGRRDELQAAPEVQKAARELAAREKADKEYLALAQRVLAGAVDHPAGSAPVLLDAPSAAPGGSSMGAGAPMGRTLPQGSAMSGMTDMQGPADAVPLPRRGLWTVRGAVTQLRIAELARTAAQKPGSHEQATGGGPPPMESEESLSAQRLLSAVLAQTSFYLPTRYMEQKDYGAAIAMLSIAAEISPASPNIKYRLAAAYALHGDRKQARTHLAAAIDAGWNDRDKLASDPAFSALRAKGELQPLLDRLAPAPPAAPPHQD